MVVKATKAENGFVYFNDERRVAYTGKGAIGRSYGWFPITPTHVRLANEFLAAQGILSNSK